ncbi:MAG TPA: hypothetical protein VFS21_15695 [Roseiflexaceae bacterium]|nr:hypothetical protein [Roseiflexaceae bacterium]
MLVKMGVGVVLAAIGVAVHVYGQPALLVVVGIGLGFVISALFDVGVRRMVVGETAFVDAVREDDDFEEKVPAQSGAARR